MDEFLDTCVFAYNTAKHDSTLYTPFQLMFGRKAVLPVDLDFESQDGKQLLIDFQNSSNNVSRKVTIIHFFTFFWPQDDISLLTASRQEFQQAAKSNIKVAQERQKQQYDQKHCRPPKFVVGMKILKKDFLRKKRKGGGMDHKWLGPYVIVDDLSKGFFSLRCLDTGKKIQRIHGAHLKQYLTPHSSPEDSIVNDPTHEESDQSLSPAGVSEHDTSIDSIPPLSPPITTPSLIKMSVPSPVANPCKSPLDESKLDSPQSTTQLPPPFEDSELNAIDISVESLLPPPPDFLSTPKFNRTRFSQV